MSTIRSLITGAAVVAAAAGSAAAVAVTGTASAGPAASLAGGSFTLQAHHGSDSSIDLGKSGFSAGDEDLIVAPLTRHGTAVGRLVGNCTTTRVGKSSADQLCEMVLHLRNGQITASGTVRSGQTGPGTYALPVLGGTGRYRDAGGQIAITATNGKTIPIKVTLR